jgi:hypothetical protein
MASAGVTYEWRNPAGLFIGDDNYIEIDSIYEIHVGKFSLITTLDGCSSYDTIPITVFALPIVDFSHLEHYLCNGDELHLDMSKPNATYLWCTGETNAMITVTEGNRYYAVKITENNCSSIDSVFIEGRPKPIFKLPNDTIICYRRIPQNRRRNNCRPLHLDQKFRIFFK